MRDTEYLFEGLDEETHKLWNGRISTNPNVMVGKPCIVGTRITVELIVEKMAYDQTPQELYASYPHLPAGSVEAALAYAYHMLHEQWKKQREEQLIGASRG